MKIHLTKTIRMKQSDVSGLPQPASTGMNPVRGREGPQRASTSSGMKYFIPILIGFIMALGGGALVAFAQGYAPLVTLPGVTEVGKKVEMGAYLAGMMKFIIALAGVFAIIIAIIGGTQYVAAGISPDAKSGAKERMFNAFIGLTLVLVSYLILNSINPNLLILNFKLPPVTGTVPSATGVTVVSGVAWGDDKKERQELFSYGIFVNQPTCKTVGQTGCTSVLNIAPIVITKLTALRNSCPACTITITGGSEYWEHKSHNAPYTRVDLRLETKLDALIKTGQSLGKQSSCSSLGLAWKLNGDIYVHEGNHWHVCY